MKQNWLVSVKEEDSNSSRVACVSVSKSFKDFWSHRISEEVGTVEVSYSSLAHYGIPSITCPSTFGPLVGTHSFNYLILMFGHCLSQFESPQQKIPWLGAFNNRNIFSHNFRGCKFLDQGSGPLSSRWDLSPWLPDSWLLALWSHGLSFICAHGEKEIFLSYFL